MTPEERLDRIEHLTAGWIEQSKAEHRENRELWRQTQRQIEEMTLRINDGFTRMQVEAAAQMTAIRAEFAERDRVWHAEIAARDRVLDERIGHLVTAIGELLRRTNGGR